MRERRWEGDLRVYISLLSLSSGNTSRWGCGPNVGPSGDLSGPPDPHRAVVTREHAVRQKVVSQLIDNNTNENGSVWILCIAQILKQLKSW
jgi:hypothetical protein